MKKPKPIDRYLLPFLTVRFQLVKAIANLDKAMDRIEYLYKKEKK